MKEKVTSVGRSEIEDLANGSKAHLAAVGFEQYLMVISPVFSLASGNKQNLLYIHQDNILRALGTLYNENKKNIDLLRDQ